MLLLLTLLSTASATKVAVSRAPCPIGEGTVRIFEKISADTLGGWDSDLVSYSSRGQWRAYAVSTCPDNLYSLYGSDMDDPVPPELAQASLERLAQLRKGLNADNLDTWDRYVIAAEMYRLRGASHRQLAQLYLEASWTARDEAVGIYMGLEGPIAARELLDAGALELEKPLDPAQRKVVLHNLARVAHRGGYMAERDRYLDQLAALGTLDAEERRVLERFRRVVTQVEPALQRQAVKELRAWLAESPADPVEVARATYLLADLARRLGEREQAVIGYALVMTSEDAPQELRDLSAWLGASLKAAPAGPSPHASPAPE